MESISLVGNAITLVGNADSGSMSAVPREIPETRQQPPLAELRCC
jgi:hypothetical protein